jgi:hypothetical protein
MTAVKIQSCFRGYKIRKIFRKGHKVFPIYDNSLVFDVSACTNTLVTFTGNKNVNRSILRQNKNVSDKKFLYFT